MVEIKLASSWLLLASCFDLVELSFHDLPLRFRAWLALALLVPLRSHAVCGLPVVWSGCVKPRTAATAGADSCTPQQRVFEQLL